MRAESLTPRQSRPPAIGRTSSIHQSLTDIGAHLFSLSTEDDPPSKLEQTAIHEAAHTAVATMIRRGIVDEVFISETAVDVTEVYDEIHTRVTGLTGGVRFHRIPTTVFENGLIAYSGFFAECESLYRSGVDLNPLLPQLRQQASHDIDTYHGLLAAEGLSEEEIRNVVVDIGSALKHYFDSGIWEAVQKVADALLAKRRLNGDEILELLSDLP